MYSQSYILYVRSFKCRSQSVAVLLLSLVLIGRRFGVRSKREAFLFIGALGMSATWPGMTPDRCAPHTANPTRRYYFKMCFQEKNWPPCTHVRLLQFCYIRGGHLSWSFLERQRCTVRSHWRVSSGHHTWITVSAPTAMAQSQSRWSCFQNTVYTIFFFFQMQIVIMVNPHLSWGNTLQTDMQ